MPLISTDDLVSLRQSAARESAEITWTKAQANAALQAIDDKWEGDRAAYGAVIETAAPGVFTNAQKKMLGKHWLAVKAGSGG